MKNKKILVLILALILITNSFVFADHRDTDIILNGKEIILEDESYINDYGNKMLPLREMAEELDYKVIWNGENREINLVDISNFIKLEINSGEIRTQDESFKLKTLPIIKDGKTYAPLEFFSKAFDVIINPNYDILRFRTVEENEESFFHKSKEEIISSKLDIYMDKLEENRNFHGSVLIAKGGEVLLNKGYGPSSFERNIENKTQTRFSIGSVTKQITATAIMQLVEDGEINIEDKISKYFPHLPKGDEITIHNLLTHTSGLENYTSTLDFFTVDIDNKNPENMLKLVIDKPLLFNPGEEYSYSNTNYLLLGMIIEKVSHMSYEDYLKENIFEPLDMNDTFVAYGKDMRVPDVNTYGGFLEIIPVDDTLILTQAYGAGNIHSTVEDLYRWDRALKEGKLVKKNTLNKMFKEHVEIAPGISYGYGWMVRKAPFGRQVFHGGNTFGSTAYIQNLEGSDITIIILTNNAQYDTETLSNTILNIIFDKPYEMPKKLEEKNMEDYSLYDKYIGQYDMGKGLIVTITREEDKLFAQLTGQESYQIYPMSEEEFFYKIVDAKITFFKENGKVNSLILNQFNQDMKAIKIK